MSHIKYVTLNNIQYIYYMCYIIYIVLFYVFHSKTSFCVFSLLCCRYSIYFLKPFYLLFICLPSVLSMFLCMTYISIMIDLIYCA